MAESQEPKPANFFASRSGVCVYVVVGGHTVRVQFAHVDSEGVVVGGSHAAAEEARRIARRALRKYQAELAPLFEKVARAMT